MDYFPVSITNANFMQNARAKSISRDNWILENKTPFPLKVYHTNPVINSLFTLVENIPPRSTYKLLPNRLKHGDRIHVKIIDHSSGKELLLGSCEIVGWFKHISLGSSNYESSGTISNVLKLNAPVNGFLVENNFPYITEVLYKNSLIAIIPPRDNKTFLGGGKSTVYVDNDRNGFQFFDEIFIKVNGENAYSIRLDDTYISKINLGVNVPGNWGPNADIVVYGIGAVGSNSGTESYAPREVILDDSWTGITYYVPSRSNPYASIKTNPYAGM